MKNKNTLTDAVVEHLIRLGSATIYEAQGAVGALSEAIKPLARGMKMAGSALTLHMRPGDNLMVHYALMHAKKGDVLIINCDGFTGAGIWGDVLTTQAQHIGLAGLVVNGAVRDSDAIIESGFPVFARGISIRGTEKKQPGTFNETLIIDDCIIRSGDIVVGDSDGLVVIEREKIDNVIKLSDEREEKENNYKNKILNGATTAELMQLNRVFDYLDVK
ncbi:RraA family protein [Symbiopectobacterium purcellii]|uniref:Putative 4-hydroxy-4-methyl-2-oxoglutarate aldolase n=1 Tax=Symbiopectobacterium purcellii TaxID=2871826 RepID=A0ABX9ANE2_9ENTR|nr:RraA family protein [Symbiopectobacterium purcellii]QZN95571.1 RraA family protein [Symbiopectobacterium purcellii]